MKSIKFILVLLWAGLAFWGVQGVIERIQEGHRLANYGSYIPWGLWVSAYIYFIGLSAGAFLLSSMVYIFGLETLKPITRTALFSAAITLLMALLSIWFDLGHMERNYEVFTRPNFHSMMAWMVWLYTGYFVLILIELWLELRVDLSLLAQKGGGLAPVYKILSLGFQCGSSESEIEAANADAHKKLKFFGILGVPLAIAFHGGVGALFATLSAKPYWNSSLFPVIFLVGALASGGALLLGILAFSKVKNKREIITFLTKIVISLLLFDVILEWAETSIPMWYGIGHESELFHTVLFGEYWYVFWVVHVLLGVLIPLALLIKGKTSMVSAGVGGFLIAITFLSVRLNLVIPGQITPELKGLEKAFIQTRLSFQYFPSEFEWSIVGFVVALGLGLFFLGKRFLPSKLKIERYDHVN